jgi:hypothetical protein
VKPTGDSDPRPLHYERRATVPDGCGWFVFRLLRSDLALSDRTAFAAVSGCSIATHCPRPPRIPSKLRSRRLSHLVGAGPRDGLHVSANPVRDACERPIQPRAARSRACGERCGAGPRYPSRRQPPARSTWRMFRSASFVPAPAPQPRRRPHAQRPGSGRGPALVAARYVKGIALFDPRTQSAAPPASRTARPRPLSSYPSAPASTTCASSLAAARPRERWASCACRLLRIRPAASTSAAHVITENEGPAMSANRNVALAASAAGADARHSSS